ncbi:ABC transporter substrate-binding protein [Streptomyces sp. R39]|uniref:ABC transporter substrate-binding protein n=1 Tax=Streptomyces sp. R39 TaxID=3238631 RepID=A0AB39QG34_9ACTN
MSSPRRITGRTTRRTIGTGALAAALTVAVAACSSQAGGPTKSGAGSRVFTLALTASPGGLDPQASQLGVVQQLGVFLYDSLIHESGDTFKSGLADRWSQRGKVLKFHLRPGITCSDGEKLTAETVAANLNYVANPKSGSPLANITVPSGATATADAAASEVTLTTPSATPFILQGIANLPIICAHGLADRKQLTQGADGTGPYVLTSSVAGSKYTLSLRSGYSWGPGGATTATQGLPHSVVVSVVTNETTTGNLLLNGGINAGTVAGPDTRRLKAAGLTKHSSTSIYGELFFNQAANSPLKSHAIRRGLTQALNLADLRAASTSGLGSAPTRLTGISPCPQDTVSGNVPAQDVAAAKAALAPLRGKKLTVRYQSKLGPAADAAMQLAVKQWNAAGATVTAEGQTDTQLLNSVFAKGDFDIAWVPVDGQNPAQTQSYFSGPTPAKGGNNFASVKDSTYATYAHQASALAGNAGCGLWAKADSAMVADSNVVPFADIDYALWSASSATFSTDFNGVVPLSIRMGK